MKFQAYLLFTILFILIFPINIFAQNNEFYNKVLRYGTDSDIIKAFSGIQDDLGKQVNMDILAVFHEHHSQKVYSILVRYIGETKLEEAEEILYQELSREKIDEDYREDIIRSLGKLKKISSLEHLKRYYFSNESSERVKKAIIDAWGDIGDPGIEGVLIQIVSDVTADKDIRGRAILALGKIKSVGSLQILQDIALNRYEDKYLRIYAVNSMGEIGGDEVLDILGELLSDDVHEVVEYAVQSIAKIDTAESGALLMQALRSDFDKVRYFAVVGITRLKYREAAEILEFKSKYDLNERVRSEAVKALEIIQPANDNGDR
jgi:HEAT repeat protein